jgi:hypothetical protein
MLRRQVGRWAAGLQDAYDGLKVLIGGGCGREGLDGGIVDELVVVFVWDVLSGDGGDREAAECVRDDVVLAGQVFHFEVVAQKRLPDAVEAATVHAGHVLLEDADERAMICPHLEVAASKQVVATLLDCPSHRSGLELDDGISSLGVDERAAASLDEESILHEGEAEAVDRRGVRDELRETVCLEGPDASFRGEKLLDAQESIVDLWRPGPGDVLLEEPPEVVRCGRKAGMEHSQLVGQA